ncbi:MAG: DUF5686 family protein [bacterium]
MKKNFFILLALLSAICNNVYSQSLSIEGNILDDEDGAALSYANIRVVGTMRGTSSNDEGEYRLYLPPGKYTLIASYLGYVSDTASVELTGKTTLLNFELSKSSINFPTVIVTPGVNPALAIIEKAIRSKGERDSKINAYKMESFTKGIFKSNQDEMENPDSNTGKMQIVGILENTGVSYYKKPEYYKDIIIARKQTANFPPEVNMMLGNRMVQSFYEDKINFFNIPIPGPLEKNALEYYDFYILDSLLTDNKIIYNIHFNTFSDSDPGFTGSIYITDESFDLIKVDVALNRAANLGGLLDSVKISQQFLPYDSLYMPVDYRIDIKLSLFGLLHLSIDLNSVMYNYSINEPEEEGLFNKAIITVLPDADNQDSLFWGNSRFIPNTGEEMKAYAKIDSIESEPKGFTNWLLNSLAEGRFHISDNFSVTSPLEMYHFNRVEGHTIGFGVFGNDLYNRRLNSQFRVDYGFDDKRLKSEFETTLLLGDYRTYKISLKAFKSIVPLFNESNSYNDFTSSLFALGFHDDFLDYYYSKGFKVSFGGDVLPILNIGLGFTNRTDNSAKKNTDFSFSEGDKKFRENPPIYETKVNTADFNFEIDFRNYIEDGYFRTRYSEGKSFITFSGGITHSSKKLFNSNMDFTIYNAKIQGVLNSYRLTALTYKLFSSYSNDAVPYQMLYSLPGTIDGAGGDMAFRTTRIGDYFGSNVYTLNLQYDFYDEFFRTFPVPLLKDCNLQVSAFFNAGWTDISKKSKDILPVSCEPLTKPLMEVGFGIGYMLLPIKLEFAWRLSHKDRNPFSIGLNTAILLK